MRRLLASPRFFRIVLGLLVVQAAWIALSGRYPMAFDEDFHLGVIRLYADHLSPFWSAHPAGGDAFGAVTRDPSYLYHYLLSFPYRLIRLLTDNPAAQVLILRFLNIGLFAAGLAIYRRLLRLSGASWTVINACLLLFVLLPIVPFLAAQINYDNLFWPLTGLALLMTWQVGETMRRHQRLDGSRLAGLAILCLLTSLVKYAFLPIFAALLAYVCYMAHRVFKNRSRLKQARLAAYGRIKPAARYGWVILLLLASLLFVERYGINLVRYHTPVPDCSQVLADEQCAAYSPWQRDRLLVAIKPADTDRSPLSYNYEWLYGMWFRLFFAVDGPASNFTTRGPLLLPALSGLVLAITGGLAILMAGRRLLKRYRASLLALFGGVMGLYVTVLWLNGYQAYLKTGEPVAINGRYLLPVLPLFMLVATLALQELLARRRQFQSVLLSVAVVCLVWGGGALTFILRSNDSWYWDNPLVRKANHAVQAIGPAVPGYDRPFLFLRSP